MDATAQVFAPATTATPQLWMVVVSLVLLAVLAGLTRVVSGGVDAWEITLSALAAISMAVLGVNHWHTIQLDEARERAAAGIERVYGVSVLSGPDLPVDPRESVSVLARVDGEMTECQVGVDASGLYVVACESDGSMVVREPVQD